MGNPRYLNYLHQHLSLNRVENTTVIEASVSNTSGIMRFTERYSDTKGSLSSTGCPCVKFVSLDDLHARGELPQPDVMKIDIEGGIFSSAGSCDATVALLKGRKCFQDY